jgi:hypothetical protein
MRLIALKVHILLRRNVREQKPTFVRSAASVGKGSIQTFPVWCSDSRYADKTDTGSKSSNGRIPAEMFVFDPYEGLVYKQVLSGRTLSKGSLRE